MRKIYQKNGFGTYEMAKIMPGESVTIMCKNFAEVNSLRALAVQFIKIREPQNIGRFSTIAEKMDDGGYKVELTAVPN